MLIEMSMDNPVFREIIDGTVKAAIAEYKKQMAELQPKWTSDLPTQEGWYWMKVDEYFEIIYIHYDAYGDPYIEGRDLYERLTERNNIWYGPIEPPEYKEPL